MSPWSPFRSQHASSTPTQSPAPSRTATGKNALKTALILTEKAVEGLPIPGLKGAVGGVVEIIKIIEKTKQNKEALQELASHLRRLEEAVIRPIIDHQTSGVSPELQARVERLTDDLKKLANDWQKLKSSSKPLLAFINYEDHALAIEEFNSRIRQSLDIFQLDNQIANTIVLENTQKVVHRLERHQLNKEVQELPRANAGFDSISRNDAPTCFKGTREGVLDGIEIWVGSGDDGPGTLILDGIAGVGKSTIAQTIAIRAAGKNCLVASFFFSRYENDRNRSTLFFSTLAFQLAQFSEAFAIRIAAALRQFPDAPHKTLPEQLKKLIIEPLQDVQLPNQQPLLIVLDALDECEEKGGAEILQLMASQFQNIPSFKIFITSRPEPHIRAIINRQQNQNRLVLHDIETRIVQSDIQLYLQYQLSLEEIIKALPECEWQIRQKDLDALVRASGRLFIVASTAEKFIKDDRRGNPQRQLEILLKGIVTEDASELSPFETLDRLYTQILEAAIPESHSVGSIIKRFQVVVGTIVILQDPLPPQPLAALLEMDVFDIKTALSRLYSVMVQSTEDQTPRIYHPSFPDFLTNPSRCKDERFLIRAKQHHSRLAAHCLGIMKQVLKRNICNIPAREQYFRNEEIHKLGEKVKTSVPRELAYACSYWATHVSKASTPDDGLLGQIEHFAYHHILHWIEVLSLIGHLDLAYPALGLAREFASSHSNRSTLVTMLTDAQRFVMGSQSIIKASSLHVYHSALPFTPHETELYKTYKAEAKQSVELLQGQRESWDPLLSVLTGHTREVASVSFSHDGTGLASAGRDRIIRVWNGITGEPISLLEGHTASITSVAFSLDGAWIASGSDDTTTQLWDVASGVHVMTLEGHSDEVGCIAFSPDSARLASGAGDGLVCVWDVETGKQVAYLGDHFEAISALLFFSDSARLVSSSYDNAVRLWNVESGVNITTIEHSDLVKSIALSPDNSQLASGSLHEIGLWDVASGELVVMLEGHSGVVEAVVFSPDGTLLASGGFDRTVRLWDVGAGAPIITMVGHVGSILSLTFVLNGARLASGSSDNTVRLWNGITGDYISTLEGHTKSISALACSPDGTRLASASGDSTIRLWDTTTNAQGAISQLGHSNYIQALEFSPDGSRLATCSLDHDVRLWDSSTGSPISVLKGHTSAISSITFSSDSTTLASRANQTIIIWSIASATQGAVLNGHTAEIRSITFSSDGARLASAAFDETVRLWDSSNGAQIAKLGGNIREVFSVAFSPDGKQLASASRDKLVRLWNGENGQEVVVLEGHLDAVLVVSFSSDGKELASGSRDKTIRLWNLASRTTVATFEGHERVSSLAFSPDNTWLAYGSKMDKVVRLWKSKTNTGGPTLSGHLSAEVVLRAFLNLGPRSKILLLQQLQETGSDILVGLRRGPHFSVQEVPVCWLPFQVQAVEAASNPSTGAVAVGTSSGQLIFLKTSSVQFG